jgi:3-methyladenine DNA glycosylase/8-oxoguanine DNA glycosylase
VAATELEAGVELRLEVRPCGPFRLPLRAGMDGVLRRRGRVLERLLHHGEEPVVVRVTQTAPDRVLFGARAPTRPAAVHGIARMRFALGVDDDLDGFRRRFRDDPLIGASLRRRPWLRVMRRPEPFEALAWAICEQLIEFERAAAIQRRLVARFGRRLPDDGVDWGGWGAGLRDAPTPAALAGAAPARLQSLDLGGGRARSLVRAAREVARGRIDLHAAEHERAWQGLRAIPGIGAWTVEMLALLGQGRYDQVPAGDLGLLKLVGRLRGGGDPWARAQEAEVREFFAPYGEWAGLAAAHLMGLVG